MKQAIVTINQRGVTEQRHLVLDGETSLSIAVRDDLGRVTSVSVNDEGTISLSGGSGFLVNEETGNLEWPTEGSDG